MVLKFSKELRLIFPIFFCCFLQAGITAQSLNNAQISGTVSSQSGQKLVGATILIKGTSKGVMTDLEGKYLIKELQPKDYVIEISHLGYKSEEKTIDLRAGEELVLDFVLEQSTEDLKNVLVQGKSLSGEVKEQAYMVSAISASGLYNSSSDAQQVLDRISGVRIMEDGGLGSDVNFTLNGFSGDQVKFFIDGIPMDHLGTGLGLSSIPINSIDRIEVYKGVVPVWLGTDALGGAVNIVTNQEANFLDASYSVGSFNTHRASVNAAYSDPISGLTLRGNVNYNYSDNNYKVWVPIREDNSIVDTAEVERFHDRFRSVSAKLETGVVQKSYADQLLIGVLAAISDKQVQHGATMNSVYGGIVQKSNSLVPVIKYKKQDIITSGLDVSLHASYNLTESEIIDTLSGVRYNWLGESTYTEGSEDGELSRTFTTIDDSDFSLQINSGYSFKDHHSLVFNYAFSSFSREVFDRENPDKIENQFPKSLDKHVAGLAYKFDPSQRWSTSLFGKFYAITARGSKVYDFGLSTQRTDTFKANKESVGYGMATSYYLLKGLQLKASYEHTYRMPTATEMFGDGLFISPNAELGPEKSHNINVGAGYDFILDDEHFFFLGSSFIYRKAEDLIYQVVTVASPLTRFDNLSETRTLGVEANLNYEWNDLLQIGGNFTFQDITDQADFVYNDSYTNTGYQKNFQKGFRLPNTPYLFGNAHAGLFFKEVVTGEDLFNVMYRYNYVHEYFLSWAELGSRDSKKIIPGQSSHDLEFSYSLEEGKYNISFEVQNITDARLYDKYFLQKPGRAFYLKFRYSL